MLSKLVFVSAAASTLVAVQTQAAPFHESFESGVGNFFVIASTPGIAMSSEVNAAAATDGASALKMEHTKATGQADLARLDHIASPDWFDALKDPDNHTMSIDFHVPLEAITNGDGNNAYWSKISFAIDGSFGPRVVADQDLVLGEANTVTLTMDLDAIAGLRTATWSQITMGILGGGPEAPQGGPAPRSPIYVDNLRVGVVLDPGGITGDFNASGQVEQGDLDLVLQNWGDDTAVNGIPAGWTNDNTDLGQIEQTELDRVLQNWGSTSAPDFTGSAVPEPASLALVGLGSLSLLARRRQG